jgi:hypothetical protein
LENLEVALQVNYDGHTLFFEFFPELEQNTDFLNLIELYKPPKERR